MKIITTEPEQLRVIYFNEFVDYMKEKSPPPHWSTGLFGVSVTHENDSHYILMPNNGQVDFRRGQVLCVRNDFSMFTLTESDISHQTLYQKYSFDFKKEKPLLDYLNNK
jgi:hypothetical protein